MKKFIVSMAISIFLLSTSYSYGDVIYTNSGGKVEGKIISEANSDVVKIKLLHGHMSINRSEVKKIVKSKTSWDYYEEKKEKMDKKNPFEHFELGLWCEENGLTEKAKNEYMFTIGIYPDHEGARRKLGYVKFDGQWYVREELMFMLGYVKYKDSWYPPQVALELFKMDKMDEAMKNKEKEEKNRIKVYERAQRRAYLYAQRSKGRIPYDMPKGQRISKGGNFSSSMQFGDGSNFSVSASGYSEVANEYRDYYIYNPEDYISNYNYNNLLNDPQINNDIKNDTRINRNSLQEAAREAAKQKLDREIIRNNKMPQAPQSQQAQPQNNTNPQSRNNNNNSQKKKEPKTSSNKGHGNNEDHDDMDNLGKGQGNHGAKDVLNPNEDEKKDGNNKDKDKGDNKDKDKGKDKNKDKGKGKDKE